MQKNYGNYLFKRLRGGKQSNLIKRHIFTIVLMFLVSILLIMFIKGKPQGSKFYYQKQLDTVLGGPFEQSISAGRYALTASIMQDHSLTLSKSLAKFSSPDVVLYKKKFISVFTPGISFLGVPFYALGQLVALPQLFSYLPILLTSIANIFLIMVLSKRVGSDYYTGLFAGLIFIFGTNALAYTFTFTQHTTSTMLILLALINATEKRTLFNDIIFGAIYGISPIIDVPNVILLAPIGIYILLKHLYVSPSIREIIFSLKKTSIGLLIGCLPFLLLFGWYNYATTGSATKIAQLIGNTNYFTVAVQNKTVQRNAPVKLEKGTLPPVGIDIPFKTRNLLNGIYILLLSDERSWIYYCPIVLLGIFGIWKAYGHDTKDLITLSVAVILVDILLYAMFGDPWGGWSFGPRYLIPSAAILCVYIGPLIKAYKKNLIFVILLALLSIYSVWVNELGALTTISIPPKEEALALQKPVPYTYAYNQQLLEQSFSSSLFYHLLLEKIISPKLFLLLLVTLTSTLLGSLYAVILTQKDERKYDL